MKDNDDYFKVNRATWNEKVKIHAQSDLYDLEVSESGLRVDYLKEYDESPYNVLPDLIKTESGMFATKDRLYPLIFTLKATKV